MSSLLFSISLIHINYYILVLSIIFLHLHHIYNTNTPKVHDLSSAQRGCRIFSIITTLHFRVLSSPSVHENKGKISSCYGPGIDQRKVKFFGIINNSTRNKLKFSFRNKTQHIYLHT